MKKFLTRKKIRNKIEVSKKIKALSILILDFLMSLDY